MKNCSPACELTIQYILISGICGFDVKRLDRKLKERCSHLTYLVATALLSQVAIVMFTLIVSTERNPGKRGWKWDPG